MDYHTANYMTVELSFLNKLPQEHPQGIYSDVVKASWPLGECTIQNLFSHKCCSDDDTCKRSEVTFTE